MYGSNSRTPALYHLAARRPDPFPGDCAGFVLEHPLPFRMPDESARPNEAPFSLVQITIVRLDQNGKDHRLKAC